MPPTKKNRLSIEQLEKQSGVVERTLRSWIKANILPGPLGRGRSSYYEEGHVTRARAIRSLRREGLSLRQVRDRLAVATAVELAQLSAPPPPPGTVPVVLPEPSFPFSTWQMIELSADMVIMVAARSPGARRMADEIYRHFAQTPRPAQ
jgi:DNA-binding transcriptional MerR regulator